jgi:DNA-binding GntR family transcriptional regulator
VLRVWVITPDELSEVHDIRVQLEGMATEAAARLIGAGQMRLVSNACQRAVEAEDADGYFENNWRFHALIYTAARRPILLGLIEGMWMRVGPLIHLALHRPGHFAHSMDCHRAAEAALRAGDATAAREAIARDISIAASDLVDVLGVPVQKRSRR